MEFLLINPDEFRKFADKNKYSSFMQTPEIAKYREMNGWTAYYFAVKQEGKIVAASLALARPVFLGKSLFIMPGGPLMDLEDSKLTTFFFTNLKKYIKTHNGFMLKISPYYELIERDRDGIKKEGGFNHQAALDNLLRLKFRPSADTSQPRYLFALDINHRSPSELLASFKRNTRNHIRKAEKKGVTVRELSRDELDAFKLITESTSKRRHFTDRDLSYYQSMYDLFHDRKEIKFIVAEAEVDGNTVPLSVAMFMLYGREVVYLFSGSDQRFMRDYNAQYLIQWYMIQYAAEHDFLRYNFYGINGLPDLHSSENGVYEFKKGFGGQVVELIGTYELPIGILYHLYKAASKLRHHN